jgi:hypothetical protein
VTPEDRVRSIFNAYIAVHPNELHAIADEGGNGNHWRVLLGHVCRVYQFQLNIHENQMRFERPVIVAIVKDCLRERSA